MSLIKELERRFESMLEGFFARQFRSGLHPIEVAKRLAREMDDNRTVGVNRVYVPNSYAVVVGPADAERLLPFRTRLCEEFSDFVTAHAQKEGYTIVGRPIVRIESDDGLGMGEFRIVSSLVDQEPSPPDGAVEESRREVDFDGTQVMRAVREGARLELPEAGKQYPLTADSFSIGRALDNDLILPDQSVSRRHAEIVKQGEVVLVHDLSSRNGTFVNDRKISSCGLKDGDEIRVGSTTLRFRSGPGV